VRGWSAVHGAGAYGCGEDVRKLAANGANMRAYTTDHLWGPVTYAVWNNNASTFEVFVDLLPQEEILEARDSRGWSLLHFAAQKGSVEIMRKLMKLGTAIDTHTYPTTHWVTDNLDGKKLTAEMIAREYHHGKAWNNAMLCLST
jgi:ankyrin repeat protein